MNVLVIGAAGFLGRHVVAALTKRGHNVRALVRRFESGQGLGWETRNVEVFVADLRTATHLTEALAGIDVVVHLAAQLKGDDATRIADTVGGTGRLLDAMAGSTVRQLVLASSFSVYDWSKIRGTLDEESAVEQTGAGRDGYAITKIRQEKLVREAAEKSGWQLTVMRPGAVWGPRAMCPPIIGQRVGSVHFVVAGTRELPLTFVENCADAFAAVVENAKAMNQTFNVVDEPQVSAWRHIGACLRRSGRTGIRVRVPYGVTKGLVRLAYVIGKPILRGKLPSVFVPRRFEARFKPLKFNSAKLKLVLGWKQPMTYEQAMEACGAATVPEAVVRGVAAEGGGV